MKPEIKNCKLRDATTGAVISKNQVPVTHSTRPGVGREFLTVSCPEGWDDVKPLVNKVLVFDNRSFTYTGWNSDRNEAYFAAPIGGSNPTARIQ